MKAVNIEKVSSLPATLVANTMYFVTVAGEPNLVDVHMSSSDGLSTKHVISKAEIQTMVNQSISGLSTTQVVGTIAARDALAPTTVTYAVVMDATGDPTVTSGAATYIYNPTTSTWTKVSEAESMDFVFTWASIQGKPTSAVADIDDAVAKRHTHANMVVLDGLTDVSGALYFGGQPVNGTLVTEGW